jgi:tRNA threonylcarbamoyladenosine biosynthesis protein TsaB
VKVLGLDCAGSACSAALWVDGKIMASRSEVMERGQAEALLPMIASVLDEARADIGALDRVAVTVGPGSFTGVRTGLATARGLALARNLPVIGVTSFGAAAALVAAPDAREPLLIALESKRAELFLQLFETGKAHEAALVSLDGWAVFAPSGRFYLSGDGAQRFAAGLGRSGPILLPARESHAISAARLAAVMPAPASPPRPLYLRAPDVTFPSQHQKSAP